MSKDWYARPVLAVRDAPKALQFYASKLGFTEDWRHEEDGRLKSIREFVDNLLHRGVFHCCVTTTLPSVRASGLSGCRLASGSTWKGSGS